LPVIATHEKHGEKKSEPLRGEQSEGEDNETTQTAGTWDRYSPRMVCRTDNVRCGKQLNGEKGGREKGGQSTLPWRGE